MMLKVRWVGLRRRLTVSFKAFFLFVWDMGVVVIAVTSSAGNCESQWAGYARYFVFADVEI
jgi:hypothetical protein